MNVATRYAKSIFELAAEQNAVGQIAEDMELIKSTISNSSDLQSVLNSPLVSKKDKIAAFSGIFEKSHAYSKNLFTAMAHKNREALITDVAKTFLELKNAAEGITEVEVTTAEEISTEDLKGIEQYVKVHTHAKSVQITTKTDSNLIGGFKISFDGKLYDSSISTQFNKLKKELKLA